MFDDERYRERKAEVEKRHPNFSTAIPSYSRDSAAASKAQVGMSWDKVIGKDVKSADDKDLGEIKSIGPDYVEVKEGTVSKKHYYIPKIYVSEYDGKHVRVSLTKR